MKENMPEGTVHDSSMWCKLNDVTRVLPGYASGDTGTVPLSHRQAQGNDKRKVEIKWRIFIKELSD